MEGGEAGGEEEAGQTLEPLLWSITGFDEERDEPVLRQCRLLERVFDELALDGGRLSAGDRTRAEAHAVTTATAGSETEDEPPLAGVLAPPHFTSLAYGEVLFEPFAELLLHTVWPHWQRQHDGGTAWRTFVDLGSGLGKALWVARLVPGGFTHKAVGIELLTPLHDAAVAAHERLQHTAGILRDQAETVTLINGDFLVEDWSDADVVFCCCVTFGRALMEGISGRAARLLRPGSIFLTVGQPLPPPPPSSPPGASLAAPWKLVEKVACDFSWASCNVYIHLITSTLPS